MFSRNAQRLEQGKMLENHADAQATGHRGRFHLHRPVLPDQLALVGAQQAVHHLDQGALAGAVLAQECVHLAGLDAEGNLVVRDTAGECLGQAPRLQQWGGRMRTPVAFREALCSRVCVGEGRSSSCPRILLEPRSMDT